MNKEYFLKTFRQEHQIIRDTLFDLITSFIQKDIDKAKELLTGLDEFTGPHFRFEEESLYPALIPIFGVHYINKLYTDHDLAIARAKRLATIIAFKNLDEEDYIMAINNVRSILPHVSDCEGLSIMVEKFEETKITTITDSMKEARKENISLMKWADTIRERKPLIIN